MFSRILCRMLVKASLFVSQKDTVKTCHTFMREWLRPKITSSSKHVLYQHMLWQLTNSFAVCSHILDFCVSTLIWLTLVWGPQWCRQTINNVVPCLILKFVWREVLNAGGNRLHRLETSLCIQQIPPLPLICSIPSCLTKFQQLVPYHDSQLNPSHNLKAAFQKFSWPWELNHAMKMGHFWTWWAAHFS